MEIRAEEISQVLKQQIKNYEAQEKRELNCEIKCKKAAISRSSNAMWKIMKITYLECIDSGNEDGCVGEAIAFCVRACLSK